MAKWIRLCLAVLLVATGLVLTSCGRGRGYDTRTAAGRDTTAYPHHSLLKGAAAGAVAGHMLGHHAVAGAVVGAIVQHERNKRARR